MKIQTQNKFQEKYIRVKNVHKDLTSLTTTWHLQCFYGLANNPNSFGCDVPVDVF